MVRTRRCRQWCEWVAKHAPTCWYWIYAGAWLSIIFRGIRTYLHMGSVSSPLPYQGKTFLIKGFNWRFQFGTYNGVSPSAMQLQSHQHQHFPGSGNIRVHMPRCCPLSNSSTAIVLHPAGVLYLNALLESLVYKIRASGQGRYRCIQSKFGFFITSSFIARLCNFYNGIFQEFPKYVIWWLKSFYFFR